MPPGRSWLRGPAMPNFGNFLPSRTENNTERLMKNALAISLIACMPLVCVAQGRRGFGGGPGLGGRGGVEVFSRTTVTGAPFSATETMTAHQTLANGNQISQTEQVKLYRDA